jgi:hypothetical protein
MVAMKTLKHLLIGASFLFLGWLSVGCGHAQVTPTNHRVDLSWGAPAASGSWAGCTTAAPCTYVASRITLASGVTTCPAANVSTPNYTPLNTASPAAGLTYADTSASGLTVCYIVQTEQASAVSGPSNVSGPFAVPASPLAPSLSGNPIVAEVEPVPQGNSAAPTLTARLTPVR